MVTSETHSPGSAGHLVAFAGAITLSFMLTAATLATELTKPGTKKPILTTGIEAVDGRTFTDKHNQLYRLVDIRTPEEGDICKDSGGALYDCAARVKVMLRTIAGGFINCLPAGEPHANGALPVRCTDMADRDIGRLMVAAGWALPDETGIDLAFDAMEAQARGKGLWQGRFRIKRR